MKQKLFTSVCAFLIFLPSFTVSAQGDIIIVSPNPLQPIVVGTPPYFNAAFNNHNPSSSIGINGLIPVYMNASFGLAGGDPGWTLYSFTAGNQVSLAGGISLQSYTLSDAVGPTSDFDPLLSYSWNIVTVPNNNLSADNLILDLSHFYNPYDGIFSTYATPSNLFLTYTPAPEPSVLAFVSLACTFIVSARLKKYLNLRANPSARGAKEK